MASLLEHALGYAEMGLSVVPIHSASQGRCSCGNSKCESPGKHPRMSWKGYSETAATTDQIENWWRRFPQSNIGIVTGQISNLAVVDIDDNRGVEALRGIGLDVDSVDAPVVQTGGGGLHIYCRYPSGDHTLLTRTGVLDKVDIRADGGIIIAPPSVHASGSPYQWVEGMSLEDMDPPELDLSWAMSTNGHRPKGEARQASVEYWFEQVLRGVGQGTRNDSATRLAGRYLGMGMTQGEVLLLLEAWNQSNDPPLPRRDLEVVIDSIARREGAQQDLLSREDALHKISNALKKVEALDIRRITGDDPQFILVFREGTAQISTEGILSPPTFVSSIAKATKIVVRKLSHKTAPKHTELAQWIMDASRDEDAGVEATARGEIESLVTDYLDAQRVTTVEDPSAVPARGCFRIKQVVWLSLDDLVSWARSKGIRISNKTTAQQLKTLNWGKKQFSTDIGGVRIVWSAGE